MTLLRVVEWPDKALETKSDLVTTFDDELRSLVADMHETMDRSNGIGLAANQVDITKQIITIFIPFEGNRYEDDEDGHEPEPWHDQRYTIINPVIKARQGKIKWQEGCLSFPEIFEYVDRAAEVWVEANDEHGRQISIHGTGLFAVCLQHEIDHINGIVFFNRMSRLKASTVKKKMIRRGKMVLADD